MMDGLIVLHTRATRVLFSESYTPNFGLPMEGKGAGRPARSLVVPPLPFLSLEIVAHHTHIY